MVYIIENNRLFDILYLIFLNVLCSIAFAIRYNMKVISFIKNNSFIQYNLKECIGMLKLNLNSCIIFQYEKMYVNHWNIDIFTYDLTWGYKDAYWS